VGAWPAADDEISLAEIAIRTNDLDTWASVSGLSERLSTEEVAATGLATLSVLDVHFEPPAPVTIPLDDGDEASVEFTWSRRTIAQPLREITVPQEAWLLLRLSNPRHLDEIVNSVGELRNFVSLAIGRPVRVLSVRALSESGEDAGEEERTWVELLWAIPHNPEPSGPRRTSYVSTAWAWARY